MFFVTKCTFNISGGGIERFLYYFCPFNTSYSQYIAFYFFTSFLFTCRANGAA